MSNKLETDCKIFLCDNINVHTLQWLIARHVADQSSRFAETLMFVLRCNLYSLLNVCRELNPLEFLRSTLQNLPIHCNHSVKYFAAKIKEYNWRGCYSG